MRDVLRRRAETLAAAEAGSLTKHPQARKGHLCQPGPPSRSSKEKLAPSDTETLEEVESFPLWNEDPPFPEPELEARYGPAEEPPKTEGMSGNGWPKDSTFTGEKEEDVEMFIPRFETSYHWARLPPYENSAEGRTRAEKDKIVIMMDSITGRALGEVTLCKNQTYGNYTLITAALWKTFPVSRRLIITHEMREARALLTYHTFTQTVDGEVMDPEGYLERAEWYQRHLPDNLHREFGRIFLNGLADQNQAFSIWGRIGDDKDLDGILKAYKAHAKGKVGKKVAPLAEEDFIHGRTAPMAKGTLTGNSKATGSSPELTQLSKTITRSNSAVSKMAGIVEAQSRTMDLQSRDISRIVRAMDAFTFSQSHAQVQRVPREVTPNPRIQSIEDSSSSNTGAGSGQAHQPRVTTQGAPAIGRMNPFTRDYQPMWGQGQGLAQYTPAGMPLPVGHAGPVDTPPMSARDQHCPSMSNGS